MTTYKIKIPRKLSFSFSAYLNNILDELTSEIKDKIEKDSSIQLFTILTDFSSDLFSVLGIDPENMKISESKKETTTGEGLFIMPNVLYQIIFENSKAKYEVKLSRDYNGHMGYNEDDLVALLTYGEKTYRVRSYLFLDKDFEINSENITIDESEQLKSILMNQLM